MQSMKDNGMRPQMKGMVWEYKYGQTGQCMKDTGKMIKPTDKEN